MSGKYIEKNIFMCFDGNISLPFKWIKIRKLKKRILAISFYIIFFYFNLQVNLGK